MATWIVGFVIAGAVYLAAKSVWKTQKSGGCSGCSSCGGGCSHCAQLPNTQLKK